MTALDDVAVHRVPCSECGRSRLLGVELAALAVVPAAGPTRQEVIVDVSVTVLDGCERCA